MSLIDRIREGIYKIRVIPKDTAEDRTTFTKEEDSLPNKLNEEIDAGARIDLSDITNVTKLKGTRNQKYSVFEEMVADGRIGAAVEMYANDAVQYNQQGKVVWVDSTDSDVANYCNRLLEDLNIAENLWSYAYCLVLYGDVYLELFKNTSANGKRPTLLLEPVNHNTSVLSQVDIKGSKLQRYVEKVPNSADVYDLQYKGKTFGYIRTKADDLQSQLDNNAYMYTGLISDVTILNSTKFVHFCLSPNINRYPEKFRLIKDNENKQIREDGTIDGSNYEGSSSDLSFTVKTGQSVLENVYAPYQTLRLKEDSVLLERVTKSSITRIIQVELGDMPESQKKRKLREIKNQIEQQLQFNKQAGSIQSRAGSQPIENIIYTTTKDGKGAISTVNIGGDVNIGDLSDVEQSENKVFGALLVPKAALGADMDGTGLSNGGSLTELNTTYARRIRRIQLALISGLETLINIFAIADGIADRIIGNFSVKLTPIITVEDNRRDELMQTKIRNVNDILSLFNDIDEVDNMTKLDMIIEWLGNYLSQQDIVDILNDLLTQLEDDKQQEAEEDVTNEDNTSDFTPSSGSPIDSAFPDLNDTSMEDFDIDEGPDLNSIEPEENTEPTPQIAPQQDIADIEGQDLV